MTSKTFTFFLFWMAGAFRCTPSPVEAANNKTDPVQDVAVLCVGPATSSRTDCAAEQPNLNAAVSAKLTQAFLDQGLTPPAWLNRRLVRDLSSSASSSSSAGQNCQYGHSNFCHGWAMPQNGSAVLSYGGGTRDLATPRQDNSTAFAIEFTALLAQAAQQAYLDVAYQNTTSLFCNETLLDITCLAFVDYKMQGAPAVKTCLPPYCAASLQLLRAGDWVQGDIGCGISVAAQRRKAAAAGGNLGPAGNQVMVLNTTLPAAGQANLGSPNQACNVSLVLGPGVGAGGTPGQVGSNCRSLGNGLIISKNGDTLAPLANDKGGIMTFTFAAPVLLFGLGLLDEAGKSTLVVTLVDGTTQTFTTEARAANNYQYLHVGLQPVVKATLTLRDDAAVTLMEVGTLEPVNQCSIN